jgi:rRNA-processing protein FCF1
MRIIFDTNFLIDIVRFKISLERISTLVLGRCEFFTLDSILNELSEIANGKSKESRYAKVALKIIKEKRIRILKSRGKADSAILNIVDEDTAVATNDTELKKLLKKRKAKIIYIKSRKHLGID